MKNILYIILLMGITFSACKKDDESIPEPTPVEDNSERCKLSKIEYSWWFPFKPYEDMANSFAPKKMAMDSLWKEINPNVFRKEHKTLTDVDTIVVYNEYGDIIHFEYNNQYGTGERIKYTYDYSYTLNGKTFRRLTRQTNTYFIPTFFTRDYDFHYTGNKLDSITTGKSTIVRYTYLTENTRVLKHKYNWAISENYYAVEHLDHFGRVTMLDIRRSSFNTTAAKVDYTYECD